MADIEKTESLELNKPAEGDIGWHTPLNENWDILDSWLVGMVLPFAGKTVPKGFLLCNGQAVSREDYKRLFDVIGTTYGEGNKSTTFNVPDFRDRTFWGGETAGEKLDGTVPNIKGGVAFAIGAFFNNGIRSGNGVFKGATNRGTSSYNGYDDQVVQSRKEGYIPFNAANSNARYKDGAGVRPESYRVMMCIKY